MTQSTLSSQSILVHIKSAVKDFPGGTVDKQSACQGRGHGFDSRSRKIPHAMEQLGPFAATAEAHVPRACALQQKKPPP